MFVPISPAEVLFTKSELARLHLHFYHPTAQKLYNLLRRARPSDTPPETRRILEQISLDCKHCREHFPGPYRFRVALPLDEVTFNEEVALDVMYLDSQPVLHVVDLQVAYQNAEFLEKQSADDIWETFLRCWATVYLGFPNRMRVDRARVFTGRRSEQLTNLHGITLQFSGVEAHNALGIGERYHAPLRRVYHVVRAASPSIDRSTALRCAVKGVNDSMGPEGFIPTLLVYGTMPNFPVRNITQPKQRERMVALAAARSEMATITADLRVSRALRAKLPPATRYDLVPGDNVLVYREETSHRGRRAGKYVGPFRISKIRDKQVFVIRPDGEAQYSVTQVIPDPVERGDRELLRLLHTMREHKSNDDIEHPEVFSTETLGFGDPRQYSTEFTEAKRKELQGLIDRQVFSVVDKKDVPANANILRTRFLLVIKDSGTPEELCKARLVVRGNKDADKDTLVHCSPNIRQSSVRIAVCVAALLDLRMWAQDVNQAYLQSDQKLQREIFVVPPPELQLPEDKLLKLELPLYGVSDAGDYWHETFRRHVQYDLDMVPTVVKESA